MEQALAEKTLLGNSKLSSAILSVYIDSATDLPRIHPDENPDPFAILTVSKTERLTSVKKETDAPVWEQGFTFLVENPENDALQLQIIGQTHKKSGECLGQFTYNICNLLIQNDLKNVLQAFQLKKSGATSKVKLSMALKILQRSGTKSLEIIQYENVSKLRRQSSQEDSSSTSEEDSTKEKSIEQSQHQLSIDRSMGLGSIKITLHYNTNDHVLSITIHKIM